MAPVNGRPFLDYQLAKLAREGCRKVVLCTGYLADKIQSHYGAGYLGMELLYSHEQSPLGTGGAIRQAITQLEESEFLVLNGDSLFDVPLADFMTRHRHDQNDCSLALRAVPEASRYGQVVLDGTRITSFLEKSADKQAGLINGGIYLINKTVFMRSTPMDKTFSIEKDFFQAQCAALRMGGFAYDAYFIDIGIPEDYKQAQDDFKRFAF